MIKLSKKWSYAIKAMVYIKTCSEIVKIWQISKDLDISDSLLRRIVSELEKSWLIISVKWRNWGIKLSKDSSKISMYDILDSVWEELSITDCTKTGECSNINNCSTTAFYWALQKWINSLLKMYTLDKIWK